MKKNLFIAALLCSISFVGKAANLEVKVAAIAKKPTITAVIANPYRVKLLLEMPFDCPKQGFTVICYGYTSLQVAQQYLFYQTHLDC